MKTAAVICEYNPFHTGHLVQINLIKKTFGQDTVIVSLMSGSCVQRGTLSVYPKYDRAKAAVLCGSDLVLELPCQYSFGSAEYFANGAVKLLNYLGGIDVLCFGSECGSLDMLKAASENLSSDRFLSAIKEQKSSYSHARTSQMIYSSLFGCGYPTLPNDILAVEYLTALSKSHSEIIPFTYKREKGYSATKSREAIYSFGELNEHIPSAALSVFSKLIPTDDKKYESIALHTLISKGQDVLSHYSAMNGGVSGLLCKNALVSSSLSELISKSTSKAYPSSRLRRALLSSVTEITGKDREEEPLYTTLLAASRLGCDFLSRVRKDTKLCIVTKPSDYTALPQNAKRQFELGIRCDRLFHICRGESPSKALSFTPYIEKQQNDFSATDTECSLT